MSWIDYFNACQSGDKLAAFDALASLGMRPLPIREDAATGAIKIPVGNNWGNQPIDVRRDTLSRMIRENVPCGVGVQPDGYVVLDIDPKDKNRANLPDAWREATSILFGVESWPETLIVKTKSGSHVWFALPVELRDKWHASGRGKIRLPLQCGGAIEFFTGGDKQSQVATPPTADKVIVLGIAPIEAPQSLVEVIETLLAPQTIPVHTVPVATVATDQATAWWQQRLNTLVAGVSSAEVGNRHERYRAAVRTIAGYAASLGLQDQVDVAFERLSNAHREVKPEVSDYVLTATFNWSWSRGVSQPLQAPSYLNPPTPPTPPANNNGGNGGGNGNNNTGPTVDECATLFASRYRIKGVQDAIYIYNDDKKYYEHFNKEMFSNKVSGFLADYLASHPIQTRQGLEYREFSLSMANSVIKFVRSKIKWDVDAMNPAGIINVANGLLNCNTRVLSPHTPDVFTTRKYNWEWQEGTTTKPVAFLEFLGSVLGVSGQKNDDLMNEIAVIQEYLGYILSGNNNYHKILLLTGPPRSGKGTLLSVIEAIIGREQMTGSNPSAFVSNFGLQTMVGKRLLAFPDLRSGSVTRDGQSVFVERLLSLSSNDIMTIDRKNQSPWEGQLNAVCVIATNMMPRFIDDSPALANRFLPIRFKTSFLGRENPNLARELREGVCDIVKWALDGYDRLKANNGFTVTLGATEAVEELAELGNPIITFINENIIEHAGSKIACSIVYDRYRTWCENNGFSPTNSAMFGRRLNDTLTFPHGRTRLRDMGELRTFYTGFTLN